MESWVQFTAKDPRGQVWGFENKPWVEINGWAFEGRVEALDLTALPASVMGRPWQESCIEVLQIGSLQLPLLDTEGGSAARCATVLEAVSRVGVSAADYAAAQEAMRDAEIVRERASAFATATEAQGASAKQEGGDHYLNMGVQPWAVIDTWPKEQQIGFYRGNALKYIMRCGTKDEAPGEIAKARHYVEKLLEVLQ